MDSIQYSQAVSAKVNQAREDAGLSVLSLSEKTGIPRSTLDRKIHGHADFSVREIKAIAIALNTSAANLTVIEDRIAAAA